MLACSGGSDGTEAHIKDTRMAKRIFPADIPYSFSCSHKLRLDPKNLLLNYLFIFFPLASIYIFHFQLIIVFVYGLRNREVFIWRFHLELRPLTLLYVFCELRSGRLFTKAGQCWAARNPIRFTRKRKSHFREDFEDFLTTSERRGLSKEIHVSRLLMLVIAEIYSENTRRW